MTALVHAKSAVERVGRGANVRGLPQTNGLERRRHTWITSTNTSRYQPNVYSTRLRAYVDV